MAGNLILVVLFSSGKHIGRLGHQDPGEFPEEVKALFEKAVEYYEENMVSNVNINLGSFQILSGYFSATVVSRIKAGVKAVQAC